MHSSQAVMGSQPPSRAASHLGVVHVPEKAVGLGVQNKVPPQKLAAVLILLDVQKPTDSVLSIHIRHSWALLTSPCMAGRREVLMRRVKRALPQDLEELHSGFTHLCKKVGFYPSSSFPSALPSVSFPKAPNVPPQPEPGNFYQFCSISRHPNALTCTQQIS